MEQDNSGSLANKYPKIDVLPLDRAKSAEILWLVLLALSVIFTSILFRFFWRPIVFAIVIGIGLYPVHLKITKVIPQRNVSALISALLVLFIFIFSIAFVTSALSSEIIRAAQYIGRTTQTAGVSATLLHPANRIVAWLNKYADLQRTGLRSAIDSLPARISQLLFATATAIVAGVASFLIQGTITLFILFFVFRDGPDAARRIAALLPIEQERVDRVLLRIRGTVFANLYGILAVAFGQGFLTGAAFAILGIPSPILFGICAALFSLVPVVGPALVWLPGSMFLFATDHWLKGLFLLAWGAIVVGLADNVIRPLVVVGRVKLHPLILLFALVGGVKQFGFTGLFIGPVVISLILALIDMLPDHTSESKQALAPFGPSC